MNLKDKLAFLKGKSQELQVVAKSTTPQQVVLNKNIQLSSMRDSLTVLKQTSSFPMSFSIDSFKRTIRLIILLDVSGSMYGTESDIYEGMCELCKSHSEDNILFSLIAFNAESKTIYKDTPISMVEPKRILVSGHTNLNGALYNTIKEFVENSDSYNLFVTISDGADTEIKVNESQVQALINGFNNNMNSFYFLGEARFLEDEAFLKAEINDIIERAQKLGFKRDHVEVFARQSAGNKLNFQVISSMLDDLLSIGSISPDWSEPIKKNLLALTSGKRGH